MYTIELSVLKVKLLNCHFKNYNLMTSCISQLYPCICQNTFINNGFVVKLCHIFLGLSSLNLQQLAALAAAQASVNNSSPGILSLSQ